MDAIQSSIDYRRQNRIYTCGSLHRVGYNSYQSTRYQSMATTYFRLSQLAISACTSTQTLVCADTLTSSLPGVMRRCVNSVPSVGTCRSRSCNHWSRLWYCCGLITLMVSASVFRRPASDCPRRSCSSPSGLQHSSLRPRHRCAHLSTLAAYC